MYETNTIGWVSAIFKLGNIFNSIKIILSRSDCISKINIYLFNLYVYKYKDHQLILVKFGPKPNTVHVCIHK